MSPATLRTPLVPRTRATFTGGELARAALVSESGHAHRRAFAGELGEVLGVPEPILTASGRAGLLAILRAAGRPRVVVPAYTCNAVTEAALLAGVRIDYAEIEAGGVNVDPDAVLPLLGPDAVFVATHQFGIPCAIERLVAMAREKGALVVEDCAASLGTRVSRQLTGTFGDAAFFSFDVAKLLSIPLKGGAVVAKDPSLRAAIRAAHETSTTPLPSSLRARFLASSAALLALQENHLYRGFHALRFERTGTFTAEGKLRTEGLGPSIFFRHRMAEWQAWIGRRQLARLDALVADRRALYARYRARLARVATFALPPHDARAEWAPIRFPIRVPDDKMTFYREAASRGVDFAFSFTFLESPPTFTRAHRLAAEVLDLPFYAGLTRDEESRVCLALTALDDERASSLTRASSSGT